MAVAISRQGRTSIRAFGQKATIPQNSYAQLMYYLNCVGTCLPNFDIPANLTDCNQYLGLDEDDKEMLLVLAALLSPDLLLGKVFLLVPNNHPVLQGNSNQFYQIRETESLRALATDLQDAIVIQGRNVEITKVMILTMSWLEKNYINPIKYCAGVLTTPKPSPPPITARPSPPQIQPRRQSECCTLL